ncbi:MAG TPA: response regulator [Brevundimonas sp.]|jgi:CheY-like chemotaxis protein
MGHPGLRVLLVEDEFLQADDLSSALTDQGARVVGPASSIIEALDLLDADDRVDAAVIDINLHGDTSMALAYRLMTDNIPFVFLTGYDRSWLTSAFAGIEVWPKPFEFPTLRAWLEKRMDQAEPAS